MHRSLKLRVKRSGVIKLQVFRDLPDGNLFIAESRKHIPFDIKRVYFINNLANSKAIRGRHAHKRLEQVIFCVSGSFVLHLDDGLTKQRIKLNDASCGIRLGSCLWHTMGSFSYDCVIVVFASALYDESDYIRDYDSFLKLAMPQLKPCI
jgi:dTDP-4-dehydrorhamnose 3,5-epimerase-like enzyme